MRIDMLQSGGRSLFVVLIGLMMLANGVSFSATAILVAFLCCLGLVFMRTQPAQPLGLLTVKVAIALFVFALWWVLAVSSSSWWQLAALCAAAAYSLWVLIRYAEVQISPNSEVLLRDVLVAGAAIALILVLRGWIHFIPILAAMSAGAAIVHFRLLSHRATLERMAILATSTFGALISRWLLSGAEIRIWMTYDQQFRASLATGLTRWGWTNWNSAPGQKIRYHWLSEATAGFLSRVTRADEFDSVARIMPILGITAVLAIALLLLHELEVSPAIALLVSVPLIGLHSALEVFSIGTLWGGLWALVAIFLTLRCWDRAKNRRHTLIRESLLIVVVTISLLTQSTVGMTLGVFLGAIYVLHIVNGYRTLTTAVYTGIGLGAVAMTISQTILMSRGGTAYGADLRNFVREGWRFHPADLLMLTMMAILATRGFFKTRTFLIPSIYALSAMLLANVVRIGGHEGRMLAEAQLVVSIVGIGAITSFTRSVSSLPRPQPRLTILVATGVVLLLVCGWGFENVELFGRTNVQVGILLFASGALIILASKKVRTTEKMISFAMALVLSALYLPLSYTHAVERNLGLVTRRIFPLEQVQGDANIDRCLNWVRSSTGPSSLVASNMWRIPGAEDQKYFIVSLKTKRLVLVDGPTYVANTGTYQEPAVLENFKNLIDYFVWSPSLTRLEELRATGVDVLIVDETRKRSGRIGHYLSRVITNPRCSVYVI